MTKPDSRAQRADQLRRSAEEAIEKRAGMLPPDDLEAQTPEEIRLIFHELYVHQVELEMQNEELRQAQEALDRERSRYLDLYDLAPAGYCTLSDQGVIVEANRAAASMLGVDREALIDQPLYRFIDNEDRDTFYLRQKNDFCEPQACELRMVKVDKTLLWVHLATSAVRDIGGRRECRLVMSDITERKRADDALRESEEHYRRIVETAREGIWEFDQNWHTTYTNPRITELLGLESKDMAGRPFDDFIYAEDEADHIRRLQQGEQGKGETYERRLRRNDGQKIWVLISATAQFDPQGRFIGSFAMLTDITRRKRAEELLKQSEQHVREVNNLLKMVLDTIPVRLFWKDLALTFLGCNRLFAQDAGFQVPEELIGLDDYSMGWSEQAEKYRRDDFEVITSGKPKLQYEETQTTPDGKQIWLSTSKVPLRDAEGKTIGVLGSYEDVTRRKLIEEELIKVQKIESLGLLAGGVAHDFNNILMVIIGNVSLAKSHFTPADSIYERLTTIETAAMKAKDLSEQFLTFAKGGDPVKQPISVDNLVWTYSRLTLSGTQSICEYSFADDLWTIDADEGLIGQALTNILINADQATAGGGIIKVSCENVIIPADDERAMKSGRYVKIAIKDQGEGIPEEHLAKVFEPYFTTKDKGSGLGLTSAFHITKKHEGYLTVESTVGEGSTFTFFLPASPSSLAPPQTEESDWHAGSGKILVMDDDVILLDMVGAMLDRLGFEAEYATDGEQAVKKYDLALITGKPFDAVIMDLIIPTGMGGREAMERLLTIDPQIKAIVSSGYSNNTVLADYASYGFSEVLVKPYRFSDLSKKLKKVLNA